MWQQVSWETISCCECVCVCVCVCARTVHSPFNSVCTAPLNVSHVWICVLALTWSPTNEVKKIKGPDVPTHHPSPPLLSQGPSRHISVMAPYRSRGLLVHTQCPSIGTSQRVSEGCFTSCGSLSACVCVCKTALDHILERETRVCSARPRPSNLRHTS